MSCNPDREYGNETKSEKNIREKKGKPRVVDRVLARPDINKESNDRSKDIRTKKS